MPGTPREFVALVDAFLTTDRPWAVILDEWRWEDGTPVSMAEWDDLRALVAYTLRMRRRRAHREPQRKAMRLLRRLLSPAQRAQLRRLRYFYATAASGATYRLDPRRGHAERVERHGPRGRWYVKRAYCLHDDQDADAMPPADVTAAHLLLLMADEAAFLAEANESRRDDQLWNGEYLRRMRRRHLEPTET